MDLPRSGSLSALRDDTFGGNDNSERFYFINFNNEQHERDDIDDNFEILLLPEITKRSFTAPCAARLSPPLHPPKVTPRPVSHPNAMTNGDNDGDANVSPTRIALSNIQDFVETTIVLRKDKNNELGISIVGGNDTYLESICVMEVHQDSAAYRDGRLRKGDLILAVNEMSLRSVCFNDAVRVLKDAMSPLRLLILREDAQKLFTTHQCPTKFITVELRKGSIKDKLGLSIMQRTNGRGVFITYVPGSIAAHHGLQILQGDQILEINGQNVRESNQKDVSHIMSNLDGAIVLLLGRVPSHFASIQEWTRKRVQICLRTRTSTWSSYSGTGNCKEKLQNQRPSLPLNKESSFFQTNLLSPESETGTGSIVTIGPTNFPEQEQSGFASRSSSIRSRSRLSIVAEDLKNRDSVESEDVEGDDNCSGSENLLLPSIKVTEF